jgi:hypothetical protein
MGEAFAQAGFLNGLDMFHGCYRLSMKEITRPLYTMRGRYAIQENDFVIFLGNEVCTFFLRAWNHQQSAQSVEDGGLFVDAEENQPVHLGCL